MLMLHNGCNSDCIAPDLLYCKLLYAYALLLDTAFVCAIDVCVCLSGLSV